MDIPDLLTLFLKKVFPNWGTWAPGLALAPAPAPALALALGGPGDPESPGGALGGPGLWPWALALGPGPGPVALTSDLFGVSCLGHGMLADHGTCLVSLAW